MVIIQKNYWLQESNWETARHEELQQKEKEDVEDPDVIFISPAKMPTPPIVVILNRFVRISKFWTNNQNVCGLKKFWIEPEGTVEFL